MILSFSNPLVRYKGNSFSVQILCRVKDRVWGCSENEGPAPGQGEGGPLGILPRLKEPLEFCLYN
jgi:hypothetical protein